MATVNKDFRVKHGLVVEGSTATVNGSNVLTENSAEFIQDAAASLFTNGTHSGITFTYDDAGNVINTSVTNPTFTDSIIFEGATVDSYETTLFVTDPTADHTITLPDATGTVALTSDITSAISGLSTSDITEGTNLYYTASRAKAEAADLLTNATKTNIVITKDGSNNLTITAENGVADSTTSDLAEGSNLYFTAERAQDAIGTLISNGSQSGITVTYTDASDKIDFSVANQWTGKTTSDLSEGSNLYFTDERAQDAVGNNLGTGLSYNDTTGAISVTTNTYDAYGSASAVAGDLSTHISDTSTHGITSTIVGASETQTLSNKTISDALTFKDGSNSANTIDSSGNNLVLDSSAGSIILTTPSGAAYLGSATSGNEIATHVYVDNAVSGLNWKEAVNVLGTSNVPLTGSTPLTVDSHTLSNGYRLLLKGQSTASQNGIYDLAISGGSYTLTRAADADAYTELVGASVFVMEGTVYANSSWVQSNHYLTDFSGQSWTQFSGQGTYTAGTGITLTGNQFSNSGVLSITGTTDQVNASASTGAVTLSLPQSIATSSTPTFGSLTLTGALTSTAITLTNTQVGDATATAGTSATVIDSWDATNYSSAKYVVQLKKGTDIEVIEVLVTVDGNNNVYLTEYADVISNTQLGTTSADYSAGSVRLLVTAAAAATSVKVHKTLIEA